MVQVFFPLDNIKLDNIKKDTEERSSKHKTRADQGWRLPSRSPAGASVSD
jgi:hypothetical protein